MRSCKKENISFEAEALALLARAAAGSMRDALSLLDQAIAHGGGKVGAASVGDMLGTIDQSHLARLLEAVAAGDAAGAVKIADEMQARSLSFDAALADLASLLLQVALAQSVADPADDARVRELAGRIDAESVQLYYQIALQGREDLPLAPDEHAGFVMTVLRMLAFRPEGGAKALPITPVSIDARRPLQPPPLRNQAAGRSSCSSFRSAARRASSRATRSSSAATARASSWWCRRPRRISPSAATWTS